MACNATSNITSSATSNALNSTIGFITLKGSHFTSPLLVFPIVVAGLCSIAFAVLIFISWRKKVASEWSRKKLAVLSSILIGMFIGYIRSVADGTVHELQIKVPKAYLVVPALKPVIANGTDVTLIALIYVIIKNRFRHVRPGGYNVWHQLHKKAIIVLLTLLALADTFLYIDVQAIAWGKTIETSFCKSVDHNKEIKTLIAMADWYQRIHLIYTSIFLAVTLEIVACIIFVRKRFPVQSMRSRIITYLLILVSPALVIRSITVVVQAILYIYLNRYESPWVEVLASMLWDIPAIFIYTGLILIQYQKDWESVEWSAAYGNVVEKSPGSDMSEGQGKISKEPTVTRVDSGFSSAPPRSNIGYLQRSDTGAPLQKFDTACSDLGVLQQNGKMRKEHTVTEVDSDLISSSPMSNTESPFLRSNTGSPLPKSSISFSLPRSSITSSGLDKPEQDNKTWMKPVVTRIDSGPTLPSRSNAESPLPKSNIASSISGSDIEPSQPSLNTTSFLPKTNTASSGLSMSEQEGEMGEEVAISGFDFNLPALPLSPNSGTPLPETETECSPPNSNNSSPLPKTNPSSFRNQDPDHWLRNGWHN